MSADRWTAWGCWAAVRVPEWNTTIYWKVICKLPVVLTGVCFQKFLIFGYSVLTSILVAKTSTILLVVLQFNTRLDPDGFRVLQICHVLFWDGLYWTSLTKNIRNHITVVKIILKGNFIFTHSGYLNQDETLHAVIPIKWSKYESNCVSTGAIIPECCTSKAEKQASWGSHHPSKWNHWCTFFLP